MEDQDKEIEITRDDILMITLHQDVASWIGVEPMEYQEYINQLLPWQEDDKIITELRPVDIECQCLLVAITNNLQKNYKEYDDYTGTMLTKLIITLRTGTYSYPSRIRKMQDGAVVYLAVKRKANQAWWCEVEPDPHTKLMESLKEFV